jgi:C4-dicarboxylate transporter, DctQ subunit
MTKRLGVIEDWLAGAALAICFGTVSLELFSRVVIGYSFRWSEELSRYLLIWLTYLGAAGAARDGLHIRITFVLDRLKQRSRRTIELITLALCTSFCVGMTWFGFHLVMDSYNLGLMSADSTLAVPIWVFQTIVPIGFIVMAVRLMTRAWFLLRGGKPLS